MKLTGQKVQQICDALVDAYPTRDMLRMLARFELDENLEEIAGGENQSVVVFNLVTWAERNGRLDDLISRAHRRTPGNEAVKQLAAEWRAQASSDTAAQLTSPLAGRAEGSGPASIDLFLSYSRKDGDAMHLVQDALREAGLSVWTDEGLEPATQSWPDTISEAVKQAHAMVVLLSPNSLQSTWVKNEISFAQTLNKRIFPVLIAGEVATSVPISLITAQWVDGRQNLDHAVKQDLLPPLRRHLESLAGRQAPTPASAGQEVAVQEVTMQAPVGLPDGAAPKTRIPGGTLYSSMLLWIPLALLVGALGLFVAERYFFFPPPPAPTPAATDPVPTNTGTPGVAISTQGVAILEGSPTLLPTEVFTPTPPATSTPHPTATSPPEPTATSPPQPTATWTTTPAPAATATRAPAPTASQPLSPLPGATKTNPKDGAEYVYVPPGPFAMGSAEGDALARADEKPQTSVNLDGFWIMRTEVTNGQYKRCVEQAACTAPNSARWDDPAYADHPVTGVTWQQANDYAAWVGGRLPTEAEWEKACRGTEGRIYPWGDFDPTADLANYFPNAGGTTPVKKYSPQGDSPYGVADMSGNVWEWTSSQLQAYPYAAGDGREDLAGEANRVLRGGAWYLSDDFVRCAGRFSYGPSYGHYDFGFRAVSPGSQAHIEMPSP